MSPSTTTMLAVMVAANSRAKRDFMAGAVLQPGSLEVVERDLAVEQKAQQALGAPAHRTPSGLSFSLTIKRSSFAVGSGIGAPLA